jgi:hypothetical protein
VSQKTKSLHVACEQLLSDQVSNRFSLLLWLFRLTGSTPP